MKAIIIFYDGKSLSQENAVALARRIHEYTESRTGSIHIDSISDHEITKLITEVGINAANTRGVVLEAKAEPEMTPADHAVVYVGTMFKSPLAKGTANFVSALSQKLWNIRTYPSKEDPNRELTNAIHILTEENISVSKSLLEKYHFTVETFSAIRELSKLL